jgi:hypothetical protein
VPEDAVRSKTVSRPVLPAICDLQGDFQKLQGEPIRWHSNFVMVSRGCKGFSLLSEQGAFFGICREEQRGIASGGRVGADSTSHSSGAAGEGGVWRHARQRKFRERTVSLGIRGAFWCRLSTAAIARGKPFNASSEHFIVGTQGKDMPAAMRPTQGHHGGRR